MNKIKTDHSNLLIIYFFTRKPALPNEENAGTLPRLFIGKNRISTDFRNAVQARKQRTIKSFNLYLDNS